VGFESEYLLSWIDIREMDPLGLESTRSNTTGTSKSVYSRAEVSSLVYGDA
jgi:hypothetical protein